MSEEKKQSSYIKIKAKVRLVNDKLAIYDKSLESNLYDNLNKIYNGHISSVGSNIKNYTVIKSFTEDNIKYKTNNYTKCRTRYNKPCIINDLYDKDVLAYMNILPYNFESNGKKIIGISIRFTFIQEVSLP
jgi:hypothetical protein